MSYPRNVRWRCRRHHLRDKLEPIGRLDVLDDVAKKAKESLDRLPKSRDLLRIDFTHGVNSELDRTFDPEAAKIGSKDQRLCLFFRRDDHFHASLLQSLS